MNRHTPGPWHRGSLESYDAFTGRPHRYVYRGDNESTETRIRIPGGEGEAGKQFDCDADALLISCAPELLAGCERALAALENAPTNDPVDSPGFLEREATRVHLKALIFNARGC